MGTALNNYDLRPPSRGRPTSRFASYLDTTVLNETRENIAPSRNRSSTPSAAVRRALQVLDETKRQQSIFKNDRWSRSVDYKRIYNEPNRNHRSPSPIRSRSTSPIRNYSPSLWGPNRLMEMERDNFHDALDDSEARREILLRKLADAQKTMELQNERLRDGEMDVSECRATIRLLQQVQKELEVKTQFLQKERDSFLTKSKQDAEEKETLKRKIEETTHESTRLRCQLDLLLADKQQHHLTLQHMHKSIKDLKEQLKNKTEMHLASCNELSASKDRLKLNKQQCELLEKEKSHALSELEKSQKKQQTLVNRNTDLGQRMGRCQADLQELSERYDKANYDLGHNREDLTMCRDKIKKQNSDLAELRRSHAELLADRERGLKYNEELEKTLQSMKEINKELKQAKVKCEDDLTDLHGDLARTRLELTRISDDNIANKTQLVESRKSCKKLTDEVLQLRPQVDELSGKVQEWEGVHRVDVQKLALLEAQKSQLTCEKEDTFTRLTSLKGSYEELKAHHEKETKKLSKETRELRQEKERIASQYRESQAQNLRIRDELVANNEHTQTQLDHWRQACSKLTSLVEEKDEDFRVCAIQRREAEENCALSEAQKRTLEVQLSEAHASQEELTRLRMEQKKLSQECAENQQMISVLEMQRDILAKSPSKINSSDSGSKSQLEKLETELSNARVKLSQVEAERNELLQRLNGANFQVDTNELKRIKGMNQILAEEVAKAKQDLETLQELLDEKSRINERDEREWKREKQQLDLRMASMVDEMNALKSNQFRKTNENNTELNSLKKEVQWMKEDLDAKNQELMVLKGEMVVIENAKKRAEDRVSILEDSLEEARDKRTRDFAQSPEKQREKANADLRIKDAKLEAAEAENAVLRLQAHELENTKSSQSTLIEALKKQLEKSTTSSGDSDSSANQVNLTKELKNLKKELLKTSEEISSKDKQLSDLKKKFLESQRIEQRLRQERDELHGKAIIMESLNDSSHDLLKELEGVRKEKSSLEKQLNNVLTSKTSQTPPTTLALVDDLDRELEKQYRTVCERNKWLESRIASLQREIELLHDQNSLAQEQKHAAERETAKLREDLKQLSMLLMKQETWLRFSGQQNRLQNATDQIPNLQITSKGARRQKEAEQIHLQHSNAEKMHKIMDLERDLSEKKQLIRAMTKEMETLQKKSEKGKISAFMKKLRRSSDSGSRDQQRILDLNDDGESSVPFRGFVSPSHSFDLGYSTMTTKQPPQRRANSLSPKSKSASFGGFPETNRLKSPKISTQQDPLSPTLTNVTSTDAGTDRYTPSTGGRKRSPLGGQLRVSFDDSSDQENEGTGDSPSSKHETRSASFASSSPKHDSARGDDGAFYAEDYIDEDSRPPIIQTPKERLSKAPSPESQEPFPEELAGLPSPTSSPSLPSPTGAKLRNLSVYVASASDESEEFDFASDEVEGIAQNQGHYPPPMRVIPPDPQSFAKQSTSAPPRPRSQPTFDESSSRTSKASQSKKKRSSLV